MTAPWELQEGHGWHRTGPGTHVQRLQLQPVHLQGCLQADLGAGTPLWCRPHKPVSFDPRKPAHWAYVQQSAIFPHEARRGTFELGTWEGAVKA